jgi:hypothetical protein
VKDLGLIWGGTASRSDSFSFRFREIAIHQILYIQNMCLFVEPQS